MPRKVDDVKLRDVAGLVQMKPPTLSRTKRVVAGTYNVEGYRLAARAVLPRGLFDYLDGGAEDEWTLRRNRSVFDRWGLVPTWGAVNGPDLSTTILGKPSTLPLTLSPTGATRMFHPEGELAVAKAASRAGIPYGLAGLSTVSLEQIASASPSLDRWMSFGLTDDMAVMNAKLDRCRANGYDTLIVSLDTRALGSRERDRRNGFTAPPSLTLATLAGIAVRPGWWLRFLAADGIRFPNLAPAEAGAATVTPSMWQQILGHSDSTKGWEHIARLREEWEGSIVLKGCVSVDDAAQAAALGIDAVQLSNHGGRQLDGMISPLDCLQETRERVGDSIQLIVDSGVRRGTDIAIALALGADACSIGRPYLYGLTAAGTAGVTGVISILRDELSRAMALMGVSTIDELKRRGPSLLRNL